MSKNRSLRKPKIINHLEGTEGDEDDAPVVAPAAVKAAQQQKAKAKKASLLSFDDESARRGKHRAAHRIPPAPLSATIAAAPGVAYSHVSSAGEYTAQRLKELQQNFRRPPPTGDILSTHRDIDAIGTIPQVPAVPAAAAGHAAHNQVAVERSSGLPTQATSGVSPEGSDGDEGDGEGASVPDQATVREAKARRERIRNGLPVAEYIPLSGGSFEGAIALARRRNAGHPSIEAEPAMDGPGSDVSDGDVEIEDVSRVQFVGTGLDASATMQKKDVMMMQYGGIAAAVEVPVQHNEDEEADAWVEEQLRKGMAGGSVRGIVSETNSLNGRGRRMPDGNLDVGARGEASGATAIERGRGPLTSQAAEIKSAAGQAMKKLEAALERAELSRRQSEKNLVRTERNLQECAKDIQRNEDDFTSAGERYVFMQRLQGYLAALCAMLAEKSPVAEELQDELGRAQEDRAAAHADKCTDARREEAQLATAAAEAAASALEAGAPIAAATSAADLAARAAEDVLMSGSHIEIALDELGRDVNVARRTRAAKRLGGAAADRAAEEDAFARNSEAASGGLWEEPALGEATTSESEEESEQYRSRHKEVLETASAVFGDVAADFGSITAIKSRLEEWKARYPVQYRDAYVSLSAPALFAPFVRLQLLKWDPLALVQMLETAFDQQEWYGQLFDYGMPQDGSQPSPDDPDANLIPQIVKALVVPVAQRTLDKVWNPWSLKQSKNAAEMMADIMIYLPHESEGVRGLMQTIVEKLREGVESLAIPRWPIKVWEASPRARVHAARQFGRTLRLMRSVCAFASVLPPATVRNLALTGILQRHLVPCLQAAAGDVELVVTRAKRVLAALPEAWLQPGSVPDELKALRVLLMDLKSTVEVEKPAAKHIAQLLARLG